MSDSSYQHVTVLLQKAVDSLEIKEGGFYIDGTFGLGGHSKAILSKLDSTGRLLVFDKDPNAILTAKKLQQIDARVDVFPGSFTKMPEVVERENLTGKISGILLDLGVSSPQLDDASRGFSFMNNGPLDMRMDSSMGITAAQWIASASEKTVAQILKDYGEERYAKRIAKAIVEERQKNAITQTSQLAEIIKGAHPNWDKHRHPATKSFQAIRIFINRELEELKTLLDSTIELLAVGGRLVIISFHSLEDRLVKRFIQQQCSGDNFPADLPITDDKLNRRVKKINKAVKASNEEVKNNPRSRSAVMRIAEKIA